MCWLCLHQANLRVDVGGALHWTQHPHFQRTPEPNCSNCQNGDRCSPALHRVSSTFLLLFAASFTVVGFQCFFTLAAPLTFFRDQSCTDILHLYHKLRSEVSSEEEEATVSLCSLLHISAATPHSLCVNICVRAGLAGWTGHRLRHSRNVYRAPGKGADTSTALQTELAFETASRGFSLDFPLTGSKRKFQEARRGFGREGVAKSVPRTAATNDRLPRFRTFQAASGSLWVSGKVTLWITFELCTTATKMH